MERDIQNFAPQVYAQTVPGMLGDQHRVLLGALENFLSRRPSPTLLVLGCGGEVLPYSFRYRGGAMAGSNVRRIKAMVRDGRIILLDVSDSAESGLRRSQEVLTHCGFFARKRFRCCRAGGKTFVPEGRVQSADFPRSSIVLLQQNLRDPLLIADASVDAIDANLTLHHVTQTRELARKAFCELYRTLKPGGLLHMGEGHLDTSYCERKICRIGADLAELLGREVAVEDRRDPRYPLHYILKAGSKDSVLRVSAAIKAADIYISSDAIVHLYPRRIGVESHAMPNARKISGELNRRGYQQCLIMADHLAIPLIDPLLDSDRKSLIDGVDAYYSAALNRCRRAYANKRDELVRATENAVAIERGRAASGIVEYYMGEALIQESLAEVGFRDLRLVRDSEPFYNILATKPPAPRLRQL